MTFTAGVLNDMLASPRLHCHILVLCSLSSVNSCYSLVFGVDDLAYHRLAQPNALQSLVHWAPVSRGSQSTGYVEKHEAGCASAEQRVNELSRCIRFMTREPLTQFGVTRGLGRIRGCCNKTNQSLTIKTG